MFNSLKFWESKDPVQSQTKTEKATQSTDNYSDRRSDKQSERQIQEIQKQLFESQKFEDVVTQTVTVDQDYIQFIQPTYAQLKDIVEKLGFFPTTSENRHKLAYEKGGKFCADQAHVKKMRSVGKEMIKLIGRKIISGDFNLTRISFPIKAMVPKTALQNSTMGSCMFPYFMDKACKTNSPLQKMKYFMTSVVSASYYMNLFAKPLNPILGQTLQGSYPDGTKIYCQQISHHPPVSYFLIVGPQNSYRYSGYYAFEANAGLNSMTLINKGRRTLQFNDGTKIEGNFNKQCYSGVFLGTVRSQAQGSMWLKDQKNKISCQIKFDKVKKRQQFIYFRPSDYFEGYINSNEKQISKFYGSYCGFIDFDGVRYWDGRFMQAIKIKLQQKPLQSDFRIRQDLQTLKAGKIEQAQNAKQKLQQSQRMDAKLRQKHRNA